MSAPVDMAAVQADEDFLDLLGSDWQPSDDELARVLAAWRRDVDSEPVGELVDTGRALAAISAARKPAARRVSVLGLVATVAAVLLIVLSALGLLSLRAEPGDWLWPLHEVLYTTDGER